MIVRILSCGRSFNGLATYLTHAPDGAKTAERVAWTHTLNCANDHVPSAVDEMLWTARQAELLKQEAGISAGGRAAGPTVVKHVSLNWAPDEDPTREHMIDTANDFLRHMRWEEHQALLVAHADKEHAHVHLMLNGIHPETGLRLSDSFEQRRAQAWALAYEREQGRIYCEQRLLEPNEREDAPTRPAWMAFRKQQRDQENQEKAQREWGAESENSQNPRDKNTDWKRLKEFQRQEREDFFADGKSAFSELRTSIYQETREEFRGRWRDFYTAQKNGEDEATLKSLKAELIADQNLILEMRRDEACAALRDTRNGLYRDLLDQQRAQRHELHARHDLAQDTTLFFSALEDQRNEVQGQFREAAEETSMPAAGHGWQAEAQGAADTADEPVAAAGGMGGGGLVGGLGLGLFSLADKLFTLCTREVGATTPAPESHPRRATAFEAAAEETLQRQQREREDAETEWSRKQKREQAEIEESRRQRSYGE
jgi:hypothetical protein